MRSLRTLLRMPLNSHDQDSLSLVIQRKKTVTNFMLKIQELVSVLIREMSSLRDSGKEANRLPETMKEQD